MAYFFGCSIKLIERKLQHDDEFHASYHKGYANLKISLRRKQIELAQDGDKTMLVWLGKQILGQSDKINTMLETKEPLVIKLSFTDSYGNSDNGGGE